MKRPVLIPTVLASLALPSAAAAQQASPKTLESLQERQVEAQQSEADPATPREMRENYRRLLKITSDADKRNQVLRRLADVELAIATRSDNPKPPARRAMNLYQRLSANRSYREREADLLYRTAHAADLAGDVAAGIVALSRLIKDYPDFTLIPEARFRRAELRFVNENYRLALDDYTWLIERGEQTDFLLQAHYKRGWTRYKLARHKAALRDELKVLRMLLGPDGISETGEPRFETVSEGNRELARDALRNMTLNFATLGRQYTPGDFVAQADAGEYEYALVQALVAHYRDKERYTDASNTALTFAERNPDHPRAKAMEVEAIAALEDGDFDTEARKAKQAYVNRYGVDGQSWYGEDPLQVPKVRERLKSYLDTITKNLHATAQDTQRREDYTAAADWYGKYLEIFPESERAPELAFLRGEVLFEAARYADAARAYERAAYDLPADENSAEAAYAAVLARREAAGEQAATSETVKTATLRFAEQYPDHPQAAAALARLAEERYQAGQLTVASNVAEQIIAHEPPADQTQLTNAWRIQSAAAMDAGNYEAAEHALRWLLDNTDSNQAKYHQRLATAIYRQGETLADADNDAAAASEFLRLRDSVPAGAAEDVRATALYDAAAASVRAENLGQATRLLEQFRQSYPDNELAPEATRRLAALYLERGDKAAAAREFARVRDQEGLERSTRREAAARAARLFAETDRRDAALQAYESYLSEFEPDFETGIEARHKLATLNAEAGNTEAADKWRERLISTDAEAGNARTDRSRTLAAQASLALAENHRQSFEQARLTPPLKASLQTKKSRLETTLDAYAQATEYGISEVTTEATYRTGDLYYDFSRDLLNSPTPEELSGQELAQYKILLEEQAFPFEEKAIELHEANVERIAANGVYDEWVKKSLAQLAELVPARYAKTERMGDGIISLQ